jgi:hypothetical protein
MAVKMMPTCIPLTAKICDAPALEKSFFTVDFRPDLSAMHRALQSAEVLVFKCFESVLPMVSFACRAYVCIALSLSLSGLSILQEK